jgi:TatA/E family protein of Tat protein translocase
MFDFSPEKLLLIAAVALIFVGPKRLPAIGRSIGRWLGEFRRATGSIADEMKEGLAEPTGPAGSPSAPPPGAIPAPSPGPPPPPAQATATPPAAAPAPVAPPPVVPPAAPGPPPVAPPPPPHP